MRRSSGVVEDGWQIGNPERLQPVAGLGAGLGHLPDGSVGPQQLRELDLLKIIADVAPVVAAGLLGGMRPGFRGN